MATINSMTYMCHTWRKTCSFRGQDKSRGQIDKDWHHAISHLTPNHPLTRGRHCRRLPIQSCRHLSAVRQCPFHGCMEHLHSLPLSGGQPSSLAGLHQVTSRQPSSNHAVDARYHPAYQPEKYGQSAVLALGGGCSRHGRILQFTCGEPGHVGRRVRRGEESVSRGITGARGIGLCLLHCTGTGAAHSAGTDASSCSSITFLISSSPQRNEFYRSPARDITSLNNCR